MIIDTPVRAALRTTLVAAVALLAVPTTAYVGKRLVEQDLRVDGFRMGLGPLIQLKADVANSPHLSPARHVAMTIGH